MCDFIGKVAKESDNVIRILSETEYDELGRPIIVTDAMGQSVRYKYLPTQTRVKDRNGVETVTNFDSRGRQTSITAGNSVITYQYLDTQNKQMITTNGQTQTYEMYQNGNLKKVQMPDGKTMEYQDYDGNNNECQWDDFVVFSFVVKRGISSDIPFCCIRKPRHSSSDFDDI